MKEKWASFRVRWENDQELESNGPSKSEYFVLILLYPFLYFLSGMFHELGHIIGAIIIGAQIIDVQLSSVAFAVIVNSFERNLSFARLLGGLFQSVFFVCLSKRYKPLTFVSIFCLIYAIAEVLYIRQLMLMCSFISEIVGCLVVVVCAW